MATQEQVNGLQAQLQAAESAMRTALDDIVSAALNDPAISERHLKLLRISRSAIKDSLGMFHAAATLCSLDGGVEPNSGGQDKD